MDALSSFGDERLLSLFVAVLAREETDAATRAAVNGLGLIGTDPAVAALLSQKDGPKRKSVLSGLGYCRRLACADALVAALSAERSPAVATLIIRALGDAANAWAWQTPLAKARSEQGAIRVSAVRALVDAYLRFDGRTREAALNALAVTEAPETKDVLARAKAKADVEGRATLEALSSRLEQRAAR